MHQGRILAEGAPPELIEQCVGRQVLEVHVTEINRGLVEGNLQWSHLGNLAVVTVMTAAFFALALWSMRRRLIKSSAISFQPSVVCRP